MTVISLILIAIVAVATVIAVLWATGYIGLQGRVEPTLHHFEFMYIDSQAKGIAFDVTIRAMDQFDHVLTSYTGTNTLTSTAGISPSATTAFTEGIWAGQVILSEDDLRATISTSGDGKSGISNQFGVGDTVQVLDHFTFDAIELPVMPGEPFNITIRACDQYGYSFHNYNGTNTLTVAVGTITPFKTTAFVDGVWSGNVTIRADTGELNWINTNGLNKIGESNNFIMNPNNEPLD
ncbi:MAG: hypothetical protein ACQCN6_13610 [Candidatus Bathyarchaeia archaeon]|jgi:hypothetical protein